MPLFYEGYVQLKSVFVPYRVYTEKRSNIRSAIGTKGGILRMPAFLPKMEKFKHIEQFKTWFSEQLTNNPKYIQAVCIKDYSQYKSLETIFGTYPVNHVHKETFTFEARIKANQVFLIYDPTVSDAHKNKLLRSLLMDAAAKLSFETVYNLVHTLNRKHVQKKIDKVVLSDTAQKWGSCSSKRRIQLSSRLLFSKKSVLESIILHELVHLVHFEHSPAFYELLNTIDPKNQESVDWLKKFGHTCNP